MQGEALADPANLLSTRAFVGMDAADHAAPAVLELLVSSSIEKSGRIAARTDPSSLPSPSHSLLLSRGHCVCRVSRLHLLSRRRRPGASCLDRTSEPSPTAGHQSHDAVAKIALFPFVPSPASSASSNQTHLGPAQHTHRIVSTLFSRVRIQDS
ncbi:hypothetical protein BDZ90DRAFT_177036 [Jaminaea rosea]|uniref:Uncharacterized protein n=1 Tax=Jaminaea rosea TaxID=1569628 RepID=A0A316UQ05_9BASI|nr:hypothetical protein BDZ90DRAFT_177036 [Jaminaea rosea]PWN27392.1 hypothetical protein BDZ90DRAFT_177036 [Jaminaea rosea]